MCSREFLDGQWTYPLWRHGPLLLETGPYPMPKTLDQVLDVIHNAKHPFRQVDSRPLKSQKHRYERRKIKQILHVNGWSTGELSL